MEARKEKGKARQKLLINFLPSTFFQAKFLSLFFSQKKLVPPSTASSFVLRSNVDDACSQESQVFAREHLPMPTAFRT
jgi:hypothetical protein